MLLAGASCAGKPKDNSSSSEWQSYIHNYTTRVNIIANHYKTIVSAFEIWNEEDLAPSPGYDEYIPPQYYASLLSNAYKAIKEATNTPIIIGGLASGQTGYLAQVMQYNGGKMYLSLNFFHFIFEKC